MVAALVIVLAASFGAFALGVGDEVQESPPKASFSVNQSSQVVEATGPRSAEFATVTITHEGGDSVDTTDLHVTVDGEKAWALERQSGAPHCNNGDCHDVVSPWNGASTIESGSSTTIAAYNNGSTLDPDTENKDGFSIGPDDADPYTVLVREAGNGNQNNPSNSVRLYRGDEVKLIWESDSSGSSATLATYTVS